MREIKDHVYRLMQVELTNSQIDKWAGKCW